MIDITQPVTQEQFAALVGISQQAVSELVAREVLLRNSSLGEWLTAYCTNLREQAAGRASANGSIDLVAERARLARAQAERVEMENAVTRKELAPVTLLTEVLARTASEIAAVLEALPVQLKRTTTTMSQRDIEVMTAEIARARNVAAAIDLNLEDLDDAGDSESDSRRAEAV